ncbi:MAG TPA: methyltransferase domain-containing protein [Stellaceae bacterium]|nr:methyltransferase domain-containing protein [Stellaceae bacterium]
MNQYTPKAPATQRWDPERYRRNASFVPALGQGALEWLAARPGERILDLGCGDGALTVALAAIGETVGVDQSAEQIASAQAKGLDARVMDGAKLTFDREFDAVFSNAALHWMRDADAVIDGVWRALKPGGRFVAEMGGGDNAAVVIAALEAAVARRGADGRAANPWYFPSVEEYRARLERRGFTVERILLFPRPTPLPGRLADWLDTFAESFLALVPPGSRAQIMEEVEAATRDKLYDRDKGWSVDYVRLRFAAVKPR